MNEKIIVTVGRNVSAVKRYEPRTDNLTNFKLDMGLLIRTDNNGRDVGRPQVAMRRNYRLVKYCCYSSYCYYCHVWIHYQPAHDLASEAVMWFRCVSRFPLLDIKQFVSKAFGNSASETIILMCCL